MRYHTMNIICNSSSGNGYDGYGHKLQYISISEWNVKKFQHDERKISEPNEKQNFCCRI